MSWYVIYNNIYIYICISVSIGVEAGRCKHGHPRACVRQPINSRTINSGFMRLTCPYLVQEIDKLELTAGVDGIRLLNTAVSESQNLQTSFHNINQNHKMIRNELFAHSNEYKSLIERLDAFEQGEGVGVGKGEGAQISTRVRDIGADSLLVDRVTSTSFHSVRRLVEQITGSGITGITIDKVDDVKCLHAQLADIFCRSGNVVGVTKDLTNTPAGTLSRTIGEAVLNQLQTNGVDIRGCDSCKQQCDLSTPKTSSDYWYQPAKNKLGKRKSRNRRKNQQFKSN